MRGGCRRTRAAGRRSPAPDASYAPTTDIYLLLRAFVDELVRCGMRAACTSPGSRCAPLVLSLAREQRLRCYSHVDERCAGFFALGLAKAIGAAGRGRVHLGHRGRRAAAGGDRGARGARAAAAADGRPSAGAARERRGAGDRPAEAVRRRGQVVLRGRPPRGGRRAAALDAHARLPRLLDARWRDARGRSTSTSRCASRWCARSQLPRATRARAPRRAPYVRRALAGRLAALAAIRRCSSCVAGARRGVLVAGRHERATPREQRPARSRAPRAGRCWRTRCRARAAAPRRSPTTTRSCATQRFAPRWRPTWCCASAISRCPSRCAAGSRGSTDVRQVALDPEGAWQDPGVGAVRLARAGAGGDARAARAALADASSRAEARTGWRAGAAPTSAPPRRSVGVLGERA